MYVDSRPVNPHSGVDPLDLLPGVEIPAAKEVGKKNSNNFIN